MAVPLGIILGIVAMICWGASDFFVVKALRKTGMFRALLWSQLTNLALYAVIFLIFFQFSALSLFQAGVIIVAGLLNAVAYAIYYKGLRVGKLSIVSPTAACWGAVAAVLSTIFLGEMLMPLDILGIGFAVMGAVLVSFKLRNLLKMKAKSIIVGAEFGLVAAVFWGIFFVLFDVLVSELSWLMPLLLIKTATVFYLMSYRATSGKGASFPVNAASFVIAIGVLEAMGGMSYGLGIMSEYTAIVASVGAAFPAVTILLARLFLNEKLELNQKIGIISVLSGLVLLSL